jgi:rare lipoprotein A
VKRSRWIGGAGLAAWYEHSGRTASGEPFNPDQFTAAHHTLPFGTRVRVVIDLSRASAKALGIKGKGRVTLHYAPDLSASVTPRSQPNQTRQ